MATGKNKNKFVHVGSIIKKIIRSYQPTSGKDLTKLWALWDSSVGDTISQHAKPYAFKGNVLLVHVTNSTWMQHLHFLKKDIITEINSTLGEKRIDDIKLKIGPIV